MSPAAQEPCRVCAKPSSFVFNQVVLGHDVKYFDCQHCGYLQTEAPHWLEQAYTDAINDGDTGIMIRNQQNVGKVIMTMLALGQMRGMVIDYAGGYGILVRLLRDAGIDARWKDKYCANLLARGFEAEGNHCDLLTAFEVFEHLVDPVAELRHMLANAPAVLLSTDLITTARTPPLDWWYFGTDHGQHIGFFRISTLETMARMLGCHYRSDGHSTHLFSTAPIPSSWRPLLGRSRWWRAVARLMLRSKTISDSEHLLGVERAGLSAIASSKSH
jgi:hypothetical protein